MTDIDKRIFKLIDILKYQKIIKTQQNFCDEIGVLRQTIAKIKNDTAYFTVPHILAMCKSYNVNANWIFGRQKKVFNTENSVEIEMF